ncbi:MAG: putative manganese transporter [Eubacteriales bacterium]
MSEFFEVIKHTLLDTLPLIPFLFVTYLLLEYIEHKSAARVRAMVEKSGKYGPLLGSAAGLIPQCGFSAAAAGLYAGRVVTLGTLVAIFLSTSDEMLPVLISSRMPALTIIKILGIKFLVAVFFGFLIDLLWRRRREENAQQTIHEICTHEGCHCEEGVFRSALRHTVHVSLFVLLIGFVLNLVVFYVGVDTLSAFMERQGVLGPVLAALVGLVPNCAVSVLITELYASGVISAGSLFAGLLAGSGFGILVLFRTNRPMKENLAILALLFAIGTLTGIALDAVNLGAFLPS